jgi:isochorismate synthase
VVALFDALCDRYPTAFVSAVFLPDTGEIWMGASPETLVSVDAQGVFRTMSLAGTQPASDSAGQSVLPSQARWSHKEIEEQALVSRYIVSCFKKIRLREFEEIGPKTVQAGNLLHLRTDYSVDTQAVAFPQLGTVMLQLLHPTSAVCGMPKAPALDFILKHEAQPRSFYSGYLGPVNIGQESHLFVNLRCMRLISNQITYFAGVGITEDSDPAMEWRESVIKMQTLQQVVATVTEQAAAAPL